MLDIRKYFDHAATTPLRMEALDILQRYLVEDFGNPNSLHQFGYAAKEALETARQVIADSIGAMSSEIIFTGSGTESNNLALLGAARHLRKLKKGNHIITSCIEHPSVLKTCDALEREGFRVTRIPVDQNGQVNPEDVRAEMRSDTILVSIMHANNVVGTIQKIAEIGELTRERGIWLHSDAVQTYGKVPICVSDLAVDLLTLNAHKIGGPKGVAALYMRKGIRLLPVLFGGSQERGLRPATQNVALIAAFAEAAKLAVREQEQETQRLQTLRKYLIEQLTTQIAGCRLNGHPQDALATHVNISIAQIEGQALMLELDRLGFATSSGSACSSTDHEPSYVLLAMGKSSKTALESLRITMGRTTTRESVDLLVAALQEIVTTWRSARNIPEFTAKIH
ncbi:cysteine desulfurase family protein [Sulfoacidibacillus thermotolerans]|uniref:Cysteine desulfurase NifS n=1 Tax=Sulfoacidibacillus thermotolerans TaxID=1765684 RepID=A0A2U3D868_SULT2|nr:cysteine desulfurase family protein [Sulfoacidibacillus thermotolerans]PWI57475.1 cysteine desulfurase NifS [Sulfoacidibacillus thermotolerans]